MTRIGYRLATSSSALRRTLQNIDSLAGRTFRPPTLEEMANAA